MNYIKLVNFEIRRFFKLFSALVIAVCVFQIGAAIFLALQHNDYLKYLQMNNPGINKQLYSLKDFLNSGLYQVSVMFAVAMLLIYVFVIWYRDWFGKSSFIYRLLMLPTARHNVYFAKLTAIVLFALFLAGVQTVLLEVVKLILKTLITPTFYEEQNLVITYSYDMLAVLIPHSPLQFLLSYGIGMAFVSIIFTAILFERSFRLKGMIFAGLYTVLSFAVLLAPLIIEEFTNLFYLNELFFMLIGTGLIVLTVSVAVANYLLNKKIQV